MYPVIFEIGSIPFYSKETLLIFAFLVGISIAVKKAHFLVSQRKIAILGILLFFSGIIGSRLLYILENLDWYKLHPSEMLLSRSGFSFYGGFFLSVAISFWYLHKNRLQFLLAGDIFAPSLALGEAIGRVGCFLSGCCYGKPTNLSWGISFPSSSLPNQHFGDLPLHPVQIYFALADIFIFLVIRRIRPSSKGRVFFSYIILHSIFHFILEFFRGDNPYLILNFTASQVIALFIGLGGLLVLRLKD